MGRRRREEEGARGKRKWSKGMRRRGEKGCGDGRGERNEGCGGEEGRIIEMDSDKDEC